MLTGRDTGALQYIRGVEEPPRHRKSSPQRRHQLAAGPEGYEYGAGREKYNGARHQPLVWNGAGKSRAPGSFRDWWAFCTDEHLAAAAADASREALAAAHEVERANWGYVSSYGGDYIAEWHRGPRNAFIRDVDPTLLAGGELEPEPDPQQPSPSSISTPTLTTVSPSASALPGSFAPLSQRPRLQLPPSVHKPEDLEAMRAALEK